MLTAWRRTKEVVDEIAPVCLSTHHLNTASLPVLLPIPSITSFSEAQRARRSVAP